MHISAKERDLLGLPAPVFLYTPEQIATMLAVTEKRLFADVLWLDGHELGKPPVESIRAINIAKPEDTPIWRIEEEEFVRWARVKRFRRYERGWAKS